MKFGKKILTVSESPESICESENWIDYKTLKKLVKKCERSETDDPEKMKESAAESAFFKLLLHELRKVSQCYKKLENQLLGDLLKFIPQIQDLKSATNPSESQVAACLNLCADHDLKLILLVNYAVMNYCGFTKILKKHDKLTGFSTREMYMLNMVNKQAFSTYRRVTCASNLLEKEFAEVSEKFTSKSDSSESSKKRISVKRGLDVKRLSAATLNDTGISTTSTETEVVGESQTQGGRLLELVAMLEEHQRENLQDKNRKKQKK